ncbi:MAG: hypothetical protein IJA85_11875 [Clostridia bacterium]|nr:hypothetical protein [Clostridia bacterium]
MAKKYRIQPQKKIDWKKRGIMLCIFLAVFVIYYTACRFNFYPILPIYLTIITALAVAFIILNRGLERALPTPDDLPDDMSPEEKHDYIALATKRKGQARMVLVVLIPFILTIFIDMVILTYVEPLMASFSA